MPIYEHQCISCGKTEEHWQRLTAQLEQCLCATCGGPMKQIMSTASVNVGAVITPADTKNDFTPKGYMGQQRRHYRTEIERQQWGAKR